MTARYPGDWLSQVDPNDLPPLTPSDRLALYAFLHIHQAEIAGTQPHVWLWSEAFADLRPLLDWHRSCLVHLQRRQKREEEERRTAKKFGL